MLQKLGLLLLQEKSARSKSRSPPFLRKKILGYVVHGLQEEADGSGLNQRLKGNLMPAYNYFEGIHKEDRAKLFRARGRRYNRNNRLVKFLLPQWV